MRCDDNEAGHTEFRAVRRLSADKRSAAILDFLEEDARGHRVAGDVDAARVENRSDGTEPFVRGRTGAAPWHSGLVAPSGHASHAAASVISRRGGHTGLPPTIPTL